MQKNDILTAEINAVSSEGSGIAKISGMAVFVPQTAPGDIAEIRIVKVKRSYAYGIVSRIITPSPLRTENDCPSFRQCGGCVFRHISYAAECSLKQSRVADSINRIGKISLRSQPIIAAENFTRYRNKAQYPIDRNGNTGFYAIHSHRIIPCADCLLQPAEFSIAASALKKWITQYKISVYNEQSGEGLIRHFYLRKAEKTGNILAVLVINGRKVPAEQQLISALKEALGNNLRSIQLNINTADTNVVLGTECITIYGESYITDVICGIDIRLSPLSFYQINRSMAEQLYEKAAEYAKPENKIILDLYCGAGTIGLSMAGKAKRIIGVEIVPQAVNDARFNALNNHITNAEFICADAAEAAASLAKRNICPDTVIVDPPRKGCDEKLLQIIAGSFSPERLVYVSCDPATLARDIARLSELGYKLCEYTPVDLFPRTAHVETVCLLSRKDK